MIIEKMQRRGGPRLVAQGTAEPQQYGVEANMVQVRAGDYRVVMSWLEVLDLLGQIPARILIRSLTPEKAGQWCGMCGKIRRSLES